MTAPDIERLKELLEKASPLPWRVTHDAAHPTNKRLTSAATAHIGKLYGRDLGDAAPADANAALISALVNAAPSLLAAAERERRMEAALERIAEECNANAWTDYDAGYEHGWNQARFIARAALGDAT